MKYKEYYMDAKISIPWVEKYRPKKFDKIILDKYNKIILQNILKKNYFPNLLLYGPPGTGKTTTIINLINSFQEQNNQNKKGLVIHLNASDDRGIDIIRNQINSFVNSEALFNMGTKFVILDEVDYMTKNAQHAFKYLLQNYNKSVRFCLICNYISRIDDSLQNEFLRLRFNQLPKDDIIKFISIINTEEQLNLSNGDLFAIQKLYGSDVRSMINFMQSNQFVMSRYKIIDVNIWENLLHMIENKNRSLLKKKILDISDQYNMEIKHLIKEFICYIVRYKKNMVTVDFLNNMELIMHIPDPNVSYIINFFIEYVFLE